MCLECLYIVNSNSFSITLTCNSHPYKIKIIKINTTFIDVRSKKT